MIALAVGGLIGVLQALERVVPQISRPWVTASVARSIPLGLGPAGANGRVHVTTAGGTLREAFAQLCGATAMMRALDQTTNTWSNWLMVEPACSA